VTDLDRASMLFGFDIESDYCLGLQETKTEKVKAARKKKKMPPKGPKKNVSSHVVDNSS